jgi:hypothetical protein
MSQYLGVLYVYEEIATSQSKPSPSLVKLTAEAILVMPKEWLEQLENAASQLNGNAIAQLLTQVPKEHFWLTKEIEELVHDFDFGQIIALVQEARSL